MPSLMRAEKVGKRAKKYNFDFENHTQATDKVLEEIEELKRAIKSGNSEEIQKECGDLLFSAVNVVRLVGVDAELSLKYSVDKFIKRFSSVEKQVLKLGKQMTDFTVLELDEIYNNVKSGEENDN